MLTSILNFSVRWYQKATAGWGISFPSISYDRFQHFFWYNPPDREQAFIRKETLYQFPLAVSPDKARGYFSQMPFPEKPVDVLEDKSDLWQFPSEWSLRVSHSYLSPLSLQQGTKMTSFISTSTASNLLFPQINAVYIAFLKTQLSPANSLWYFSQIAFRNIIAFHWYPFFSKNESDNF